MINATGNRMTQEIARHSRMASNIAAKQAQVSTGKRLQRASDDTVASSRLTHLKRAQANDAARASNINLGITLTAQADGQMRTMSDLLARTKELTIAGASSELSPADRASMAEEISQMADEIDALALVKSPTGEMLFASGNSLVIRFDDHSVFAPVPARAEIFEIGGTPVSEIMRVAASAISAGNGAQTSASLTAVDGAINHAADMTAKIGLHAARLDRLQEARALRAISISEERSNLEDTDLRSAMAELNGMTLTLEAAQAAFARINRRTLMDFLS
jgi:flagellar hook-associated protein 3 FlgL